MIGAAIGSWRWHVYYKWILGEDEKHAEGVYYTSYQFILAISRWYTHRINGIYVWGGGRGRGWTWVGRGGDRHKIEIEMHWELCNVWLVNGGAINGKLWLSSPQSCEIKHRERGFMGGSGLDDTARKFDYSHKSPLACPAPSIFLRRFAVSALGRSIKVVEKECAVIGGINHFSPHPPWSMIQKQSLKKI